MLVKIIYPPDRIKAKACKQKDKYYLNHRVKMFSWHSMWPNCDTHVITNKHFGCSVYSLQTSPVHCRRPCVWIWWGGPKFMWRGTGLDTHHYSEAPGSRMNITHSPHPVSPTDGLLACQTEGLPWFPSLIDSGGSPSIISDRLSTPLNSAQGSRRVTPTWESNPPQAPSHKCIETHQWL